MTLYNNGRAVITCYQAAGGMRFTCDQDQWRLTQLFRGGSLSASNTGPYLASISQRYRSNQTNVNQIITI